MESDAVEVDAPGRVNLIGEHTDYNGGFVLPMAIPQRTHAVLRRRDDRQVHAWSADIGGEMPVVYELGTETPIAGWIDYVAGMTAACRAAHHRLGGFEIRLRSDVPLGSGLSSSASLLIAVGRGLRALFGLRVDDQGLAQLAHQAEHDFVGAPVGVMDQLACSLADDRTALFIDTYALSVRRVRLPPSAEIVVIDSGVAHQHATGDYRTRRAECEAAARALGLDWLRYAVPSKIAMLGDPLLRKRASHVVSEDARVMACVRALEDGDDVAVGALFDASHRSLREDFEATVPAVDALVAVTRALPSVHGARMTGGGFGGAIVAWVKKGSAVAVGEQACAAHAALGYVGARVLVPVPSSSRGPTEVVR